MPKTVKGSIQFSLQPKRVWQAKNPTLPSGAIEFEISDDGSAIYFLSKVNMVEGLEERLESIVAEQVQSA